MAKKKPPSRVRYEQKHPTVSCRVTLEVYNKLQTAKHSEHRSFADILKVGLGVIEIQAKKETTIWKKAYDEGHQKGFEEAKKQFEVTYPCNICGVLLTINSSEERQAVRDYLRQHGWGHQRCHEKG